MLRCAFQPKGKLLATCSVDGSVRLWDGSTGAEIKVLGKGKQSYNAVAWSPDGSRLAAVGDVEVKEKISTRVVIWDVASGNVALQFEDPHCWFQSLAWAPDGKCLAAGSTNNNEVHVWDVAGKGKLLRALAGHGNAVYGVAFSPDSRRLASASLDGTLCLWDLNDPKTPLVLKGHNDGVRCVCFSRDGKRLVSGADDQTVKLWDVVTGQEMMTFAGHQGAVTGVAFRLDGMQLATVSQDGTVHLWDATPGDDVTTPPAGQGK